MTRRFFVRRDSFFIDLPCTLLVLIRYAIIPEI